MIKHVYITGATEKKGVSKLILEIASFLKNTGVEVTLDPLITQDIFPKGQVNNKIELVICVGGDGSILKTQHKISGLNIPLLGLRLDSYGFLAGGDARNYQNVITKYLKGEYKLLKGMKLRVKADNRDIGLEAINEVLFASPDLLQARRFVLSRQDEEILEFKGDGLLISTPLGSTAYSLSAGGSRVDPHLELFSVVALNPWPPSLKPPFRSLILDPKIRLKVEIFNDPGNLIIDGLKELRGIKRIEVEASENKAIFVRV